MNANLLLLALLAPLAGAVMATLVGSGFLTGRKNPQLSQYAVISGIALAFLASLYALAFTAQGMTFNEDLYAWVSSAQFRTAIGLQIDSLSATMMCTVTFVSLIVNLYAAGYMKDDPGISRFFAGTGFFTFAMLMLVTANNFLQLFFGWEAVGFASYLLISYWFDKPAAVNAGTRAFLVNRLSDMAFIVGIGLLFASLGTFHFDEMIAWRHLLDGKTLSGTDWQVVTVACLCLFIGAMGKSAQVPLHLWLPGSMEGPTPVSALIHAATMVTAGIFMVARLSPLFELSGTALSVMLVVGASTAFFMGLVAMVQNDIKQIIAYSTISQLGFMTMGLGASAYSATVFHLTTHAFFKALLFLCAGAVIIAMNHEQDIRFMGGLRRLMPVTWATMLIGTLSLVGIPFFSGYYSKESILLAIKSSAIAGSGYAFTLAYLGFFVTAFYAFRLLFVVFCGPPQWQRRSMIEAHEEAETRPEDEIGLSKDEKLHALPAVMRGSLLVLAVPSLMAGGLLLTPFLNSPFLQPALPTDFFLSLSSATSLSDGLRFWRLTLHGIFSPPFGMVLLGIGSACLFYSLNRQLPEKLARKFARTYQLLLNGYYLDKLTERIINIARGFGDRLLALSEISNFGERTVTRVALLFGNLLWKLGELRLIDGLLVRGSTRIVTGLSVILRHLQSGYLYHYAFVMILGLLCFLLYFLPNPFFR